jgi:hypothetical protein
MKINYSHLEIMTEVAWIMGDSLEDTSRAMSRWIVCNLATKIIQDKIITKDSEDIDELITAWLIAHGEIEEDV